VGKSGGSGPSSSRNRAISRLPWDPAAVGQLEGRHGVALEPGEPDEHRMEARHQADRAVRDPLVAQHRHAARAWCEIGIT
jgi:hypothetical protein